MFKSTVKYSFGYLIILLMILHISSCSDLDTNIPPPPYVGVHGEGIDSINSPNWHGNLVKQYNYNLLVCQDCHGSDYSGGRL